MIVFVLYVVRRTRVETICFSNVRTVSVWNKVLSRNQQSYRCASWLQEVEMAINHYKGSSVLARIGRLAMSVVIYCIWQGRNYRVFQRVDREVEAIL